MNELSTYSHTRTIQNGTGDKNDFEEHAQASNLGIKDKLWC